MGVPCSVSETGFMLSLQNYSIQALKTFIFFFRYNDLGTSCNGGI